MEGRKEKEKKRVHKQRSIHPLTQILPTSRNVGVVQVLKHHHILAHSFQYPRHLVCQLIEFVWQRWLCEFRQSRLFVAEDLSVDLISTNRKQKLAPRERVAACIYVREEVSLLTIALRRFNLSSRYTNSGAFTSSRSLEDKLSMSSSIGASQLL